MIKCEECPKRADPEVTDTWARGWYEERGHIICARCVQKHHAAHLPVNRKHFTYVDPETRRQLACQEPGCLTFSPDGKEGYREGNAFKAGWYIFRGNGVCPVCVRDVYAKESLDSLDVP